MACWLVVYLANQLVSQLAGWLDTMIMIYGTHELPGLRVDQFWMTANPKGEPAGCEFRN